MLTKEEKQELRTLAASTALRDEFRRMRRNSQAAASPSLDEAIHYLTTMARLSPVAFVPRVFVPYKSVKI